MKHIFLILLLFISLLSCKKEISAVTNDEYRANLKEGLTDSLCLQTYRNFDFSRATLNRVDSIDLLVV